MNRAVQHSATLCSNFNHSFANTNTHALVAAQRLSCAVNHDRPIDGNNAASHERNFRTHNPRSQLGSCVDGNVTHTFMRVLTLLCGSLRLQSTNHTTEVLF